MNQTLHQFNLVISVAVFVTHNMLVSAIRFEISSLLNVLCNLNNFHGNLPSDKWCNAYFSHVS